MSLKSPRHHSRSGGSSGGRKKPGSSSRSRTKTPKSDDWSEVTEPDERRRIQNRIAQRKFREKARETKAREDRDALNMEHRGRAYHVPTAEDLSEDPYEESGPPWGGPSMRHIVACGHEAEGRRSSRRGDYTLDDSRNLSPDLGYNSHFASYRQLHSYGGSSGGAATAEEPCPEDELYLYGYGYDQTGAAQQHVAPFGHVAMFPGQVPVPADVWQPYDTASPGGSSSSSSFGYQGLQGL